MLDYFFSPSIINCDTSTGATTHKLKEPKSTAHVSCIRFVSWGDSCTCTLLYSAPISTNRWSHVCSFQVSPKLPGFLHCVAPRHHQLTIRYRYLRLAARRNRRRERRCSSGLHRRLSPSPVALQIEPSPIHPFAQSRLVSPESLDLTSPTTNSPRRAKTRQVRYIPSSLCRSLSTITRKTLAQGSLIVAFCCHLQASQASCSSCSVAHLALSAACSSLHISPRVDHKRTTSTSRSALSPTALSF